MDPEALEAKHVLDAGVCAKAALHQAAQEALL